MKKVYLFVFLFLLGYYEMSSQDTLDLFILAGQSNAQGWTGDAEKYPTDELRLDKDILLNWTFYNNESSNGKWVSMQAQKGRYPRGHFGPEVSFSRELLKAGYNPAIFKFCLGATGLARDWKAPGEGGIYDDMVIQLTEAILRLESAGRVVKVQGLIWIQGETDAGSEDAANSYYDNLKRLITHLRTTVLEEPHLKIILGVDEQHSFVRERPQVVIAQQKLADDDDQIVFKSMYGLPKADATHLNPQGLEMHGRRIFESFQQLSISSPVVNGDNLKVVTYNIWNGFDWGRDFERRSKVQIWMAQQKPDIVALQELCAYSDEKLNEDAKAWGHHHSALLKTTGYSVGLTSKYPIIIKEKIFEGMHHGALHCMSNGIDYLVVHLHPGSVKVRQEEAQILFDKIEVILSKNPNLIVLGDFNAHSPIDRDLYKEDGTLLTRLRKNNNGKEQSGNLINQDLDFSVISKFMSLPLYDITQKHTKGILERGSFPGRILGDVNKESEEELIARLERIDFILASEALAQKCIYSKVYNGKENWHLSDHYPVVAEFRNIYLPAKKEIPTSTFASDWEYVGVAVEEPGYTIWGSSPIMDNDGKVHLFVARWPGATVEPGWRSDSEIAHYVGKGPEGPFRFSDIAIKGTGADTWDKYGAHNPTIHKVGDQYVLLYIGNENPTQPIHPSNQKIGMATSKSLDGPWVRVGNNGLILSPPENEQFWNYSASNGVNNPAFLQHPDGGFFLYFKSEKGRMGLAIAEYLEGPYIQLPFPVTTNDRNVEDGYAFMHEGKVALLTTDNHGMIEKGGGLLWTSEDGIKFDQFEKGFHQINAYTEVDMKKVVVHYGPLKSSYAKLERPQLLIIDGLPAYLYAPSGSNIYGGSNTVSYILKYKR